MEKKIRTIGVLTSGGDAPGMNAAIRSVVRAGIHSGYDVKGIERGYTGLVYGEIRDMTTTSVSNIMQNGGTILFTARCDEMMTGEGVQDAANMCRHRGIDALVIIGGDGSFRGAKDLADQGIPVICIPGTIDLDVACTEYSIGFDTAINTAMEAIDRIRDTSTSHERVSVIEVMGRHAGYIALWSGMATGAEDIFIPECYDGDETALIERIIEQRRRGKKHHIIVNAEGVGDSEGLAKRIEEATGIETRATKLGHLQRGGSPTCEDRVKATIFGAYAIEALNEGRINRAVVYRGGRYFDVDLDEALATKRDFPMKLYNMSKEIIR